MNDILLNVFKRTFEWIRADYRSHPVRFVAELIAWVGSIASNILFAITVPHVPFVLYLSITVSQCAIFAWSAWTRRSFSVLGNYLLITAIDSVALYRAIVF